MQIIHADALEALRSLPDHSVDSIVTDPPSGTGFMGVAWDTYGSGKGQGRSSDEWDVASSKEHARTARDSYRITMKQRNTFIETITEIFTEARRVLKPGGHALVWALPRTSHWTAYALEDAGFLIRDQISHVFASGMPKSHNISKAIDRIAGVKREIVGPGQYASKRPTTYEGGNTYQMSKQARLTPLETKPATPEAQQWDGWGTGLKPAHELWILARTPLAESTIAANVLTHGTGALNIDVCRIPTQDVLGRLNTEGANGWKNSSGGPTRATYDPVAASGRWPSNFLLSHSIWCTEEQCMEGCPVLALDRQSGIRKSGLIRAGTRPKGARNTYSNDSSNGYAIEHDTYNDQGGASRFFQTFYYCPKPSRREKSAGCDELPERQGFDKNSSQLIAHVSHATGETTYNEYQPSASKNHHPTVKSQALMSYLCRMITPPGGTVLDCFAGSGTTALACIAEGFDYILIEREAEYVDIINARVKHTLAERKARRHAALAEIANIANESGCYD